MDTLHDKLVELKVRVLARDTHVDYRLGICANIHFSGAAEYRDLLTNHISFWPERSKDRFYAVPSCDRHTPYDKYMYTDDLWVGDYGAARMRLLNYLIEKTK